MPLTPLLFSFDYAIIFAATPADAATPCHADADATRRAADAICRDITLPLLFSS